MNSYYFPVAQLDICKKPFIATDQYPWLLLLIKLHIIEIISFNFLEIINNTQLRKKLPEYPLG